MPENVITVQSTWSTEVTVTGNRCKEGQSGEICLLVCVCVCVIVPNARYLCIICEVHKRVWLVVAGIIDYIDMTTDERTIFAKLEALKEIRWEIPKKICAPITF